MNEYFYVELPLSEADTEVYKELSSEYFRKGGTRIENTGTHLKARFKKQGQKSLTKQLIQYFISKEALMHGQTCMGAVVSASFLDTVRSSITDDEGNVQDTLWKDSCATARHVDGKTALVIFSEFVDGWCGDDTQHEELLTFISMFPDSWLGPKEYWEWHEGNISEEP